MKKIKILLFIQQLGLLRLVEGQINKTCHELAAWPWTCGDTCVTAWQGYDQCFCGGIKVLKNDPVWCCNSGPCEVTSLGMKHWGDHIKNVSCPGTVQSLDTPCNGTCNQATEDLDIIRSRIFCDKGKCVGENKICTGRQLCEDQTDLRLCEDNNMRNKTCPDVEAWRCNMRFPGQCVGEEVWNDGIYHCLDRSDETPFKTKNTSRLSLEKCMYDFF